MMEQKPATPSENLPVKEDSPSLPPPGGATTPSPPKTQPPAPPQPAPPPAAPAPKLPAAPPKPAPPPPPPPSPPQAPPPPPPTPPAGNMIERIRGLIRPLIIVGIVVLLGFLAFTFLSLDLSKIPIIGSLFGGKRTVELTYWGLWEEADVIQPLISSFEQAYESENPNVDVSVVYEKRSFGSLEQYKETLLTRLAQGTGPDIFRIHNSWVADFSSNLSSLPVDVLTEEEYVLRFYPVALSSAKAGADIYAIPLEYDGLVLFYNKKFFEGVDVSLTIKTWEDFRREAVRLTTWEGNDSERGKILFSGAAFGTGDNVSHSADILSLLFAQSGVNPLTELGTQAASDALTFYTNFSTEDRVWDATLPFSVNAFANEQVAMIVAPSWRALDVVNLNPQIELAAVAVPQLPGAREGGVHWGTFWMEGVSRASEGTDVAWAFLKFLTEEEQQRTFYSTASQSRLFGEPYALRSLASAVEEHDVLGSLLGSAANAVSGKIVDFSGNDSYADALKQAVRDVLAGKTATEALGTAQATINQLEGVVTEEE